MNLHPLSRSRRRLIQHLAFSECPRSERAALFPTAGWVLFRNLKPACFPGTQLANKQRRSKGRSTLPSLAQRPGTVALLLVPAKPGLATHHHIGRRQGVGRGSEKPGVFLASCSGFGRAGDIAVPVLSSDVEGDEAEGGDSSRRHVCGEGLGVESGEQERPDGRIFKSLGATQLFIYTCVFSFGVPLEGGRSRVLPWLHVCSLCAEA